MSVTHQMIKYHLNQDGTIPDFLYKGNDGIGGVFLVSDSENLFPQDVIMFGLSEYPVTLDTPGIVGILNTKEELEEYLTEILEGTLDIDPNNPQGDQIPVDIPTKVEWVWGIYTERNNLI
jgi:hypothetical protein